MTVDPSAIALAKTAVLPADHVRRFGIEPGNALLSHSNFDSPQTTCAAKARSVLAILDENHPEPGVEREMCGDTVLHKTIRVRPIPKARPSNRPS